MANESKITLKTPRGTFSGKVLTSEEAKREDYCIYFTHDKYDVYVKHIDFYHVKFAFIPRCM